MASILFCFTCIGCSGTTEWYFYSKEEEVLWDVILTLGWVSGTFSEVRDKVGWRGWSFLIVFPQPWFLETGERGLGFQPSSFAGTGWCGNSTTEGCGLRFLTWLKDWGRREYAGERGGDPKEGWPVLAKWENYLEWVSKWTKTLILLFLLLFQIYCPRPPRPLTYLRDPLELKSSLFNQNIKSSNW